MNAPKRLFNASDTRWRVLWNSHNTCHTSVTRFFQFQTTAYNRMTYMTIPSWRIRNFNHGPDAVERHGHRPTELLDVQEPTEASSGHPKGRTHKRKGGQKSNSERVPGESSSISGLKPDPKQKSFKRKPRQDLRRDFWESRKGPDPKQKGHEPSESTTEQNGGGTSSNERQEPQKLDPEQQSFEPESTSEQDFVETSADSGQEPEKTKELSEPGSEPSDSDLALSSLCEALEALKIPSPCSSSRLLTRCLSQTHSIAPEGMNVAACESLKRYAFYSKLSGYVAHHTRVGTIHALDIFPGAPSIREVGIRSDWAKTTGGGIREDADSADEDEDRHPSRFPVSTIRSTLLFHPRHDRLELKKPPKRPTMIVVGANVVRYSEKDE
ncbi:hypothetical protein EDD18DRAFT_1165362 [Armillaria luteobubalina]|uniref:Uncharacterized protein n=1 Tax=Armillaria luteobubalina TaxID=153913 RepID=A0AA39Q795_9AGAR|nr:hypothetical protein EDD18DRAFT_1165362 [Armillaria luteobubalina]